MQLNPHQAIGSCMVGGIWKELHPLSSTSPLFSWCSEQSSTGDKDLGLKFSTFKLPGSNWGLNFIRYSLAYLLTYLPFSCFSKYSSVTAWLGCQCEGQACGCRSFLYSRGLPSINTWKEAFVQIKSSGMTDLQALWKSRLGEEEKFSGVLRQSVTLYTWEA